MSSLLRITGLASGLDVDSIVKQLMQAENTKLDKVKQQRQLIEWRQEAYRDIIGSINTFKSTYFDVLKSDTYMLSDRNYSCYDTTTSDNGATFTATASGSAVTGSYKVTVSQLAEKANITGTGSEINIESSINDVKFPAQISSSIGNNVISIDIGTGAKDITIDDGNYYLPDLLSKINEKISTSTDLNNKVKAELSTDGKSIRFVGMMEITDANKQFTINVDGTDHTVTLGTGNYTFDGIASQINSTLRTDGINSKLAAGVSADGKSVTFTHTEGDSSTITINGTSIPSGSTQNSTTYFTNTLAISNSNYNSTNQVLEYDRKIIAGVNDTLSININGTAYKVQLAASTADGYGKPSSAMTDLDIRNDIISKLHTAMTTATDKDGNTVDLTTTANLDVRLSLDQSQIQFVSKSNNTVTVSGDAATTLGFSSSFEISQSINDKMSALFGGSSSGLVSFTINDGTKNVDFYYDFNSSSNSTAADGSTIIGAKNKTIDDIIDDISAKANTKLSYSQLTRKFTLESNNTGQAQSISIASKNTGDTITDNFLATLFGSARSDSGQDAKVNIVSPNSTSSGIDVVKSANNFTIDGITYNLVKADPGNPETLTVTANSQNTYDKIKNFIDKYNELIDTINSKTSEKKQYDYKPLTDAQKDDMSDDEITKWETKAKQGILSNDSILENVLFTMRRAFSDPVKVSSDDPSGSNIGITFSEIGLTTSDDTTLRGKIIIDETKLKDAIANNGDEVAELFTKSSATVSSYSPDLTSTQRTERYNESGIFQRINDILLDNVRTTRNISGQKGTLLEKAGIKGDYTEYNNLLTNELIDEDKKISDLTDKLSDKEDAYYLQYSKLEAAMQKMNSQSSWLTQMLGQ